MLHYQLNNHPRHLRTAWSEITLGEYIEIKTGNTMQGLCRVAGLELAEFQEDNQEHIMLLQLATELYVTEPEGEKPEWLPYSLGAASIGRMELCKMYLRQFAEAESLEACYPYLYQVYNPLARYDMVLALSGAGFPVDLVEMANALPVTKVIGAVQHIGQEIARIGERYAPILDKEPTAEQVQAGVERFQKYGFYATLCASADGHLGSMRVLAEMPADAFYTAMCVDTERGEYMEQLQKNANKTS